MKRLIILALLVGGAAFGVEAALAGSLDNVKVAVHVSARAKNQCTVTVPSGFSCDMPNSSSKLRVTGSVGVNYDLYLVVLDIPTNAGFSGASFAIRYPPTLGVFGRERCCDLEFPSQDWPASGSGNMFTFSAPSNCKGSTPDLWDPQGEGVAVMYRFYVYPYGEALFELTPRNLPTPDFTVADCSGAASEVNYPVWVGKAGFGVPGYQPCLVSVPVKPVTWGAIKRGMGD